MIPFFFLKIKKGKDYHVFNPVDNIEYVVNYIAYRILEQCDGEHTPDEIADSVVRDFGTAKTEAIDYVTELLDEMYRMGMIAWRQEKIGYMRKYPPPSTVFWNITGKCNLWCAHCYNFDRRLQENELKTEEIKSALEEMAIFGVENISFSGGEPFTRKDFLEIACHARDLEFKSVIIATNGTLIDTEIARHLNSSNLKVQVSIDGDVAEIHEKMRGMKGAFDRAIKGIKLLLEEGVDTSVSTTVTTLNVERIPNMIQLMQNLGIEKYRVLGIMPMGRGKQNLEKLRLTPGRMKNLVEYLDSRKIPIAGYTFALNPPPTDPVDFCGSGACSAASSTCSITAEGNVVPCTYFWGMNGNSLRDHSFQWIWENSLLLNYFRTIRLNEIKGHCRDCEYLALCHGGCKAENYADGDIFGPNRSCWVAGQKMLREQGYEVVPGRMERMVHASG